MPKTAFLFPGQGAQYPGMGRDFFEHFKEAQWIFEEADDILCRNLTKVIFEGPKSDLTQTRNSQLGIYVMSSAVLAVIRSQFPSLLPMYCAGLSLGEYTALQAAEYMTFQEGLRIVALRGQYMQEACESQKGTMAVILGTEAEFIEECVKEFNSLRSHVPQSVWVANYNCPGQLVISGTVEGVESITVMLKGKGVKRVLPLEVSGAFHSGLMLIAERNLRTHLDPMHLNTGIAKVVMNVTGEITADGTTIRSLLQKQVTHAVRWEQSIRTLMREEVNYFIEIGCGKVLGGLNKKIGVPVPTLSIECIGDLKLLEEVAV